MPNRSTACRRRIQCAKRELSQRAFTALAALGWSFLRQRPRGLSQCSGRAGTGATRDPQSALSLRRASQVGGHGVAGDRPLRRLKAVVATGLHSGTRIRLPVSVPRPLTWCVSTSPSQTRSSAARTQKPAKIMGMIKSQNSVVHAGAGGEQGFLAGLSYGIFQHS